MYRKKATKKHTAKSRWVVCSICSHRIKFSSIERHHRKAHPDGNKKLQVSKRKIKMCRNAFPPQPSIVDVAGELREALKKEIIKNEEIRSYLCDNPVITKTGNMGKPQDPYRWGYYGSSTAEYDFIKNG